MNASKYLELFSARKTCPLFDGLSGRISWSEDQFQLLDEDYYHRYSFVAGSEMLHALLGLSDEQAMERVGLPMDWVRRAANKGTKFKLFVFPSTEQTLATWKGLFRVIAMHYPLGVYSRLRPYLSTLEEFPYLFIDPEMRLKTIAELPMQQRLTHPEFMTEERLLALPSVVTLYQARAFFYHALDCNIYFTGTGTNADGEQEFVVPNASISDIKGFQSVDLRVKIAASPKCGCM